MPNGGALKAFRRIEHGVTEAGEVRFPAKEARVAEAEVTSAFLAQFLERLGEVAPGYVQIGTGYFKKADIAQFLAMPEGEAWAKSVTSGELIPEVSGYTRDNEPILYYPRLVATELGKFIMSKEFVGGTPEERYRAGVWRGAGLGGGAGAGMGYPTTGYRYPATAYEAPAPKYYPKPRYKPLGYKFLEEKEYVSPAQKTYTERMFPSLFAKFEAGRAKSEAQFRKTAFPTEAGARKAEEAREADYFAWLKKYQFEKEWWAKSPYERGEREGVFAPIRRTVRY